MDELKEWLSTEAAAKLTGYHVKYLRELARKGRILARKVSRDWLINRDDLLAHKREMAALGTQKHNPWREDLDGGRKR
jgi:excisionase family DNA binding protein